MSLPQGDTVTAYEELRSAVLSAEIGGCSGLGVLRRCGLATWMREVTDSEQRQAARSDQSPPAIAPQAAAPNALTGLMAGIVITLIKENATCLT